MQDSITASLPKDRASIRCYVTSPDYFIFSVKATVLKRGTLAGAENKPLDLRGAASQSLLIFPWCLNSPFIISKSFDDPLGKV